MSKRIITFFTFGIFLLLVGGITKIFKWSQADLLMAVGLVFELLAGLLRIIDGGCISSIVNLDTNASNPPYVLL